MSKDMLSSSHEATIRNLIEKWADATRLDRKAQVLANHASDVTIFDVLPPLKYEGTDAYRKSWDEWQPATKGPAIFEIHVEWFRFGGHPRRDDGISGGIHHGTATTQIHQRVQA